MYSAQKANETDATRTVREKESRVEANILAGHSNEPNLTEDLGAHGASATTPPYDAAVDPHHPALLSVSSLSINAV